MVYFLLYLEMIHFHNILALMPYKKRYLFGPKEVLKALMPMAKKYNV